LTESLANKTITIPELALVVLIGASGSGKSTFARTHFKPTEVLSSDTCRGLVSDDENNQAATKDAFEILHFIAAKRLAAGKLTVIDATNVQPEARRPLVDLARQYHCIPVALVLNIPEALCHERNRQRPDRSFGPHVVRQHVQQLRQSLRQLKREGFRHVFELSSPEAIAQVLIERQPLWNNRKHEHGPFDIIGDIHGCYAELLSLLTELGYQLLPDTNDPFQLTVTHPEGRKVVFLGDLVDRGPQTPQVLRLVMSMVASGVALCVPGNHDMKLLNKLRGKDVRITHGLAESLAQLDQEPAEFRQQVATFIDQLVSHYVLDDGKLVVAHAGLREELQGRGSGKVRDFALFGETTGETDEFGMRVRYNWAADYRGNAMVVYGHTPIPEPEWLNRTINLDTGCVFGGKLTALRYPEKELVAVPAQQAYYTPTKPFLPAESQAPTLTVQQQHDDILDIEDVLGKRIITTRLQRNLTVRVEQALAALEVMSRFAVHPKWLIYLPPTMSPSETSQLDGLLEHPTEAFAYYRQQGVATVICEEKHMGSRAVLIVCRSEEVARQRFGLINAGIGICYTRTGRRFFDNLALEQEFLASLQIALTNANLWQQLNSDWICLDAELMPWSVKAQELLRQQYAAVGAASQIALNHAVSMLQQASQHGQAVGDLLEHYQHRATVAANYRDVYRRYCWPVESLADLKVAPFHILASEGAVHVNNDHRWHMETIAALCQANQTLLQPTAYLLVDTTDADSQAQGIRWWEELTQRGGEGMVVKPLDFIAKGSRGLAQPAIKCRGPEYLRLIYGAEYTLPANLERLRARGLATKRSLALREFALGIEALERFVRREPLRQVHECVLGVLALESEPVDPRL
jgi:protein phosphatase